MLIELLLLTMTGGSCGAVVIRSKSGEARYLYDASARLVTTAKKDRSLILNSVLRGHIEIL
jgi:hypothetical protein